MAPAPKPTPQEREAIIESVLADLAAQYPLAERFEIAALAMAAIERFLPKETA